MTYGMIPHWFATLIWFLPCISRDVCDVIRLCGNGGSIFCNKTCSGMVLLQYDPPILLKRTYQLGENHFQDTDMSADIAEVRQERTHTGVVLT